MNASHRPLPIFVLGCPRAGTTMMGALLGSIPGVVNFGEIAAYYFATHIAEREYARVPTQFKDEYLRKLRRNAIDFLYTTAATLGHRAFCETTPWNLRVAQRLAMDFQDAIFVVVIRGYRGTIQSMRRSHARGYHWAGPTDQDRAALWSELYGQLAGFEAARIAVFNYDLFRQQPEPALAGLRTDLERLGLETATIDRSVLATSYSNLGESRLTSATSGADGRARLQVLPAYDPADWTSSDEIMARETCLNTLTMLRLRYGYRVE